MSAPMADALAAGGGGRRRKAPPSRRAGPVEARPGFADGAGRGGGDACAAPTNGIGGFLHAVLGVGKGAESEADPEPSTKRRRVGVVGCNDAWRRDGGRRDGG